MKKFSLQEVHAQVRNSDAFRNLMQRLK